VKLDSNLFHRPILFKFYRQTTYLLHDSTSAIEIIQKMAYPICFALFVDPIFHSPQQIVTFIPL